MISNCRLLTIAAFSALVVAMPALGDFNGQVILGPLSAGSFVTGNLTGAPDLNDGFTSGTHIFDIWDGGDHVYGLNWLGGDIDITLNSLNGSDADLFLYTPDSLDDASTYSARGAFDSVQLTNAAPGFYYIVIDSTFFSEGAYELTIANVPAPSAAALLGFAALTLSRRRRRA